MFKQVVKVTTLITFTHNLYIFFSWLKEKHARPETLDILFRSRADYRIKFSVSNPAFLPTRLQLSDDHEDLRLTAHEALAKMFAIEKCEIVVINPLFNSDLPYKTKVNIYFIEVCHTKLR